MIVTAGGWRYAVEQRHVRLLSRIDQHRQLPSLAVLLGALPSADEQYALSVVETDCTMLVDRADLRGTLTRLPVPAWMAPSMHVAVTGFALDGTDLVPIVDLVQLARQTGYEAP